MRTQAELIAELESLVDASTLCNVILALARMCNEKAEHLRCNWQEISANEWDRAARKLDRVAEGIDGL